MAIAQKERAFDASKLAGVIDHTVLKPHADPKLILRTIDDAARFGTYAVCLQPVWASMARTYMGESGYTQKLAIVLDFPHGSLGTPGREKLLELMINQADEFDFVMPIGKAKAAEFSYLFKDMRRLSDIVNSAKSPKVLKMIVEDAYTTPAEKVEIYSAVIKAAGPNCFIKTSTGFADLKDAQSFGNATIGATVENVTLMAKIAKAENSDISIKAAGGIATPEEAKAVWEASGMELDPMKFRLGTSRTESILNVKRSESSAY